MGHLFEKRKICHGCQGNYQSVGKGEGGRKKNGPTALRTELDFSGCNMLFLYEELYSDYGLFVLSLSLLFLSHTHTHTNTHTYTH